MYFNNLSYFEFMATEAMNNGNIKRYYLFMTLAYLSKAEIGATFALDMAKNYLTKLETKLN